MQPSMFNLRVPLPARDEVFLMNTLTDAQLLVSSDVAALLDRCVATTNPVGGFRADEWDAFKVLADNGFLVASRAVVREAHRWALARDAVVLDAPQEFPQYGEHCFATYWLDPQGIKLEAVCHRPETA